MGDVIVLRSSPIDLNSDIGHAVCRRLHARRGRTAQRHRVTEKYELSPADWQNITKDMALGRAIRAERERRTLNGTAAREAAAGILSKRREFSIRSCRRKRIAATPKSKPSKEIRAVASGGSGADRPADTEKFIIHIDLGDRRYAPRIR